MVALAAGAIASGGLAAELTAFAGTTTFTAHGSAVGRFMLPAGDLLLGMDLRSSSPHAAALVSGPGASVWLYKSGPLLVGQGHQAGVPPEQWMDGGLHFVYVISDPPGDSEVSVRFRDRQGDAHAELTEPIASRFGPLAPSMVPSVGGTGYQRFDGRQPFEGRAFTGFLVFERQVGPTFQPRELRWSTSEGITRCDAWNHVFAPILGDTLVAAADFGDHQDIALTYFHVGLGVITEQLVDGLWIQRASDDPYDEPYRAVTPPGWSTYQGNPWLDQDAECAQAQVGLLAQSIG